MGKKTVSAGAINPSQQALREGRGWSRPCWV